MPERDYLLAALPDRHIILGQLLKPFSLGHMMILRRLENGFVTEGKVQTIDDLIQGVLVCAHTYEEALEALQDPKLPKILRKWGKRVGVFNIPEKLAAFEAYLSQGSTWPKMGEPEGETREPGACFLQRIKLVHTCKLGCTPSQAVNKPFGEALYDYFGFFELEDRLRLMSQEDEEVLQEHQKMLEQEKEEFERLAKEAGKAP